MEAAALDPEQHGMACAVNCTASDARGESADAGDGVPSSTPFHAGDLSIRVLASWERVSWNQSLWVPKDKFFGESRYMWTFDRAVLVP